ncbi:IS1634 family transposase [Virgibacillus oceani]
MGKLTDKKDAAEYRYQVFEEKLDERSYRFSVVHSSQLDKQKAKRLEHEIEKEAKELNKAIEKLQKTAFHCEADAEEAKVSFEQEHKTSLHHYNLATYTEEETIKRKRRGRPKKGEKAEIKTVYKVHLKELKQDEKAIENRRRLLSTFVLMTNELDDNKVSDLEILTTYKGQSAAETRFRLLKDHQMIDAVFLKTPERIQAIGIVYVMALLIYGMLEYRVRSEMKKEKEALILKGKRKLFAPTAKVLLEQLDDIRVILIKQDGKVLRYIPDNVNNQTKRIVELCGYDMAIYVSDIGGNSDK